MCAEATGLAAHVRIPNLSSARARSWIEKWTSLAPRRRGLPVFQSHGTADPLLPYAQAEQLRDLLQGAGATVTWVPFRGGHEIPGAVIDALGRWTRAALA